MIILFGLLGFIVFCCIVSAAIDYFDKRALNPPKAKKNIKQLFCKHDWIRMDYFEDESSYCIKCGITKNE